MRAKTILTVLFLVSLVVAAWVIIHALPQSSDAATEPGGGDGDSRRHGAARGRHPVARP